MALRRVAELVAACTLIGAADSWNMQPADLSQAKIGFVQTMQDALKHQRRLTAACVMITFPASAAFYMMFV